MRTSAIKDYGKTEITYVIKIKYNTFNVYLVLTYKGKQ